MSDPGVEKVEARREQFFSELINCEYKSVVAIRRELRVISQMEGANSLESEWSKFEENYSKKLMLFSEKVPMKKTYWFAYIFVGLSGLVALVSFFFRYDQWQARGLVAPVGLISLGILLWLLFKPKHAHKLRAAVAIAGIVVYPAFIGLLVNMVTDGIPAQFPWITFLSLGAVVLTLGLLWITVRAQETQNAAEQSSLDKRREQHRVLVAAEPSV